MNSRGYRFAVVLAASAILASCAPKSDNGSVSGTGGKSGRIATEKTESDIIDEIIAAGASEENMKSKSDRFFLGDALLPRPDTSILESFMGNHGEDTASDYYEEFKEFNVPMAMTSRVNAYIKYFTERVPNTTQAWLDRSNKYMYLVRDIFVKEGLPTDLVVLAFTESGYNTHAVSHAGAAGMWQFIPSTGKLYGMENTFWVDERRDFEKATYAAAKYLKSLYERFDDWYLALAAYNAGPGKIARATKKHATRDFFAISKNRYTLKLETRDYIPKFLALLIIYKNYLKYGFTPPGEMPLLYGTVNTDTQINLYWLAGKMDVEPETLKELNPALKLPMTPPVSGYILRVPYGTEEAARQILASHTPEEKAVYKIHRAKAGEKIESIAKKYGVTVFSIKSLNGFKHDSVYKSRPVFVPYKGISDVRADREFSAYLAKLAPKYYTVKKGDTFIEIAHRNGIRQADLQRLNPSVRPGRIYPGQKLALSGDGSPAVKTASSGVAGKNAASYENMRYKVKSGDSLWSIAKKFGTTVASIKKENNLRDEKIKAGKVLSIKK